MSYLYLNCILKNIEDKARMCRIFYLILKNHISHLNYIILKNLIRLHALFSTHVQNQTRSCIKTKKRFKLNPQPPPLPPKKIRLKVYW